MNECDKSGHKRFKTVCEDCGEIANKMEFPKEPNFERSSFEYIEKTFAEYATAVETMRKVGRELLQKHFPGEPIPEYFENNFDVNMALNIIVFEIANIKHRLQQIERNT